MLTALTIITAAAVFVGVMLEKIGSTLKDGSAWKPFGQWRWAEWGVATGSVGAALTFILAVINAFSVASV